MMTDKLTPNQFDAAVRQFPRLSEDGRAAARAVLVDGSTQADVARFLEMPRQQISRWVTAIKGAHQQNKATETVKKVILPKELVAIKERRAAQKMKSSRKRSK